jgi:glycosyltransferase involved in cell wall biosynthesis
LQNTSSNPLVTVVIPTYNRIAFVQQAIASVIAQTYRNWELIVVDDGSDDGTPEAISKMTDPRIKLLKKPHTGNVALMRNTGVDEGSGEWLAFLDSDDIWIPRKLEIQLSFLLLEGKSWGYGGFELMNDDMRTIPNKAGQFRPISGWIIKDVLTTGASVTIGTLMLKRSLFEEAGRFNEDVKLIFREDYELVLRLALKSEALAVPELLVRIREHKGRATSASEDAHDRTVVMYEHFIRTGPEKALTKIARRRMAGELAESARQSIIRKKYWQATRKLGRALINGDKPRHLFSVVRRGFLATTVNGHPSTVNH